MGSAVPCFAQSCVQSPQDGPCVQPVPALWAGAGGAGLLCEALEVGRSPCKLHPQLLLATLTILSPQKRGGAARLAGADPGRQQEEGGALPTPTLAEEPGTWGPARRGGCSRPESRDRGHSPGRSDHSVACVIQPAEATSRHPCTLASPTPASTGTPSAAPWSSPGLLGASLFAALRPPPAALGASSWSEHHSPHPPLGGKPCPPPGGSPTTLCPGPGKPSVLASPASSLGLPRLCLACCGQEPVSVHPDLLQCGLQPASAFKRDFLGVDAGTWSPCPAVPRRLQPPSLRTSGRGPAVGRYGLRALGSSPALFCIYRPLAPDRELREPPAPPRSSPLPHSSS